MLNIFIGATIGLIIGWNLLPQPAWVRRLYLRVGTYIRNILADPDGEE